LEKGTGGSLIIFKMFGERKPEVVLIVFKSVGRKEPGVLEKIR
jgi:hypothetical protein